ncbi:MAG: hypothetical protein A2W31_10925 [Planctomycetes bacterium RBG_16_64_10]|nr:MAG: hypothetical protein A2W31_10925 [Planctomycetes bacterium RBG_16_64_10]
MIELLARTRRLAWLAALVLGLGAGAKPVVARPFELWLYVRDPAAFTTEQLAIVEAAMLRAENLWEGIVTGYQPGINLPGILISVQGATDLTGLALASVGQWIEQGGFWLTASGGIRIDVDIIDQYANYDGAGLNLIDDILAHEIGHILGVGLQWTENELYAPGSGRYTGRFGVAAYREEFDPAADFVPVELAGSAATAGKHWDQIMRSSVQEGNPADPFSLSPLLGITDSAGRDLALELMTGAIDPDYGAPFLSRTTVQSLRDLGFLVVGEPSAATLLVLALASLAPRVSRRRGAAGIR